jgi:hypothetical protein
VLLRLAYFGLTNTVALLRLLPMNERGEIVLAQGKQASH